MRWSVFSLFGFLGLSPPCPQRRARARTTACSSFPASAWKSLPPVKSACTSMDQLAGAAVPGTKHLVQLAARAMSRLRLKLLPGQVPGCNPGMLAPGSQEASYTPGRASSTGWR